MSNNNAVTYFLGNPGQGIATNFPKATRKYDAVTFSFVKSFADLWLAQLSYTWSRLTGNLNGLFEASSGQLDPNINATFDLATLLANADGPLSADQTHVIKAFLAKEFVITPVFSTTLGGSFNASSGIPINALGGHPIYGAGYGFIVQRGSAGRLPWNTSLDINFAVNYRITKDMQVTGRVEAFNIFNSQRPITVSENYTNQTISPILGATQGASPRPSRSPGRQELPRSSPAESAPAPRRRPARLETAHSPCRDLMRQGTPSEWVCRTQQGFSPRASRSCPGANPPPTKRFVNSGSASA